MPQRVPGEKASCPAPHGPPARRLSPALSGESRQRSGRPPRPPQDGAQGTVWRCPATTLWRCGSFRPAAEAALPEAAAAARAGRERGGYSQVRLPRRPARGAERGARGGAASAREGRGAAAGGPGAASLGAPPPLSHTESSVAAGLARLRRGAARWLRRPSNGGRPLRTSGVGQSSALRAESDQRASQSVLGG